MDVQPIDSTFRSYCQTPPSGPKQLLLALLQPQKEILHPQEFRSSDPALRAHLESLTTTLFPQNLRIAAWSIPELKRQFVETTRKLILAPLFCDRYSKSRPDPMIEMALGSSLTYSRSSIVGSLHCAAILWGRSKMDEQLMTKYFLALKNKLGLRLRSWRRTDPDFSSLHEGPTGKIRMSKLYGQEEPLYKVQSQKNRTPKYEQSWNEKEKVGGTLEAALVHILTYTNAEQWKTWADEAMRTQTLTTIEKLSA